jgi:hypothetical protein
MARSLGVLRRAGALVAEWLLRRGPLSSLERMLALLAVAALVVLALLEISLTSSDPPPRSAGIAVEVGFATPQKGVLRANRLSLSTSVFVKSCDEKALRVLVFVEVPTQPRVLSLADRVYAAIPAGATHVTFEFSEEPGIRFRPVLSRETSSAPFYIRNGVTQYLGEGEQRDRSVAVWTAIRPKTVNRTRSLRVEFSESHLISHWSFRRCYLRLPRLLGSGNQSAVMALEKAVAREGGGARLSKSGIDQVFPSGVVFADAIPAPTVQPSTWKCRARSLMAEQPGEVNCSALVKLEDPGAESTQAVLSTLYAVLLGLFAGVCVAILMRLVPHKASTPD